MSRKRSRTSRFRDLVAYRIVISIPRCHLNSEDERREVELKYLYEIANRLPEFLEETGFTPEMTGITQRNYSELLDPSIDDARLHLLNICHVFRMIKRNSIKE